MSDLPEPLTPPDCDLRHGFPYMPLHAARLRDSELAAIETPESCWAAVLLWCASWHQVPAGSVPDDDKWLASQTNYMMRGRIDDAWADVRAGALRGFVKCSDGRLYHPVVAEQALEAWLSKLVSTLSGATGNATRWGIEIDTDAVKLQIVDAAQRLRVVAPQSDWLKKKQVRAILAGAAEVAKPSPPDEQNHEPASPPDDEHGGDESPPDRPPIASRIAPDAFQVAIENVATELNRIEVNTIGSNDDVGTTKHVGPVDNSGASSFGVDEIVAFLRQRELDRGITTAKFDAGQPEIAAWVRDGITPEQLRKAYDAAVAQRVKDRQERSPVNAAFLDRLVPAAMAPPREVTPPLSSMSDVDLETEARRLGVNTYSLVRPQVIAKIAQARADRAGGHAA